MRRIGAALLISAAVMSQAALAAFTAGMTASQLQAEINTQRNQNKSALDIARAALAAGVPADSLTSAMLLASIDSGTAIEAILSAGGDAGLVQSAALANRVPQGVIDAAARRAGVTLPTAPASGMGSGTGKGFGASVPNRTGGGGTASKK